MKVLVKGVEILIDEDDADLLSIYKWHVHKRKRTFYVQRTGFSKDGKRISIHFHRQILGFPECFQVDHINGNGLDNRKENLRIVTNSQNSMNRKVNLNNTSGYKGVCRCNNSKKWKAYIWVNRKNIYLGLFNVKEEAAQAYNDASIKYHGIYGSINIIGDK